MAKKKVEENLDALIFIDTNIFLDFYRIQNANTSLKYIEEILNHLDKIIVTSQVEMEYKKNRQKVINDALIEYNKSIPNNGGVPPLIVQDYKSTKALPDKIKSIIKSREQITKRLEKIIQRPESDKVYVSLNKLFKFKSIINLDRDNMQRFRIRKLAYKRFILGYPPRKSTDNSIGDAVNWEWIVDCSIRTNKHIIIVTRDTDFGLRLNKELLLSDWLRQEFKERVSRTRKIIITDKLAKAFELVRIPVTKEMKDEEENLLNEDSPISQIDLLNDKSGLFRFSHDFTKLYEYIDRANKSKKI
ncbi:PIN domain-containing protein [Aquirufa sp. Wall-65K1]